MVDKSPIAEIVRQAREAKGLTQQELADRIGTKQQTIQKIEKGITKQSALLLPISVELEIPLDKVNPSKRRGIDLPAPEVGRKIPANELVTGRRDFPVHVAAQAGKGELIVSTDPIEWVSWPEPLAGVLRAYGLRIIGDSMSPEFRAGDIALVHPNLPPIRDETCIFYAQRDGQTTAIIKHLVRFNDTTWYVEQFKPKKTFTLSRREWSICHRTVGKYSRR